MRIGVLTQIAVSLPLAASIAAAQESTAQRERAAGAVNALMDQYTAWFASGNAEAIASSVYRAPVLWLADNEVTVLRSPEDVRQRFELGVRFLAAEGYARSEWPVRNTCVLGENAAVVSGRFIRYKSDGTRIGEYGGTYTLAKTPDGWRIVSIALHAPDRVIRCAER